MIKKQKSFLQFIEKVLRIIKHAKSGLQHFLMNDAPLLGQTVKVDRDQIQALLENNQLYRMRDSQHTQNMFPHFDMRYPNKIK